MAIIILDLRTICVAFWFIVVFVAKISFGDGFDPQALAAWQASLHENSQKYGWSIDKPQAVWRCPPLRVVKQHSNNKYEAFQLLGNWAIYSVSTEGGLEKSIYLDETYYCVFQQGNTEDWFLRQTSERNGVDYWDWDPGSRRSFSGARTLPRTLVDAPCYPLNLLKRLDELIPEASIQLVKEDETTQVYRVSPSEGFPQGGEITLSKIHGFRPINVILGDEKLRYERRFQYPNSDFTEYHYKSEVFRREGDTWVANARGKEEYTVTIDSQVLPEEFELAHYGIYLDQRSYRYPSWLWLVVAGAILIGLAVWVRAKNSRA